jgi:hypothetical protein
VPIIISLAESRNGKGRKRSASTIPKTATFAPTPRAMVATATAVKVGDLRRPRREKRKSRESESR